MILFLTSYVLPKYQYDLNRIFLNPVYKKVCQPIQTIFLSIFVCILRR